MKKLNQKGLGAVEIILILVIVGLIGGVGYYVYKQQQDVNNSLDNAQGNLQELAQQNNDQKKDEETPVEEKDPTADWKTYTSKAGKFTLKYPTSWLLAKDCPSVTKTGFYAGTDKSTLLVCNSEYGGQIGVSSMEGNIIDNFKMSKSGHDKYSSTSVTVDGVKGTRQYGVANGKSSDPFALGKGTIEVKYLFYTNGRTYHAFYNQSPSNKNVLADFDLMITKTLQFN